MARYDFVVADATSGEVCPPKLARQIKNALSLARKPKVYYQGRNKPGTDNLIEGSFTVQVRELTAPELDTLRATVRDHNPCKPFHGPDDRDDFGMDRDDLEDIFEVSQPGQIVYVRDLQRLTDGRGTLVYRSQTGWRRVSDDSEVIP